MHYIQQKTVLWLLYLTHCTGVVKTEVFTSMAALENVVLAEKRLIKEVKNYVLAEEEKLRKIKSFVSKSVREINHLKTSDQRHWYLSNPINSYLMLKRFVLQWKDVRSGIELDSAENLNALLDNIRPSLPTKGDHKGAKDAIFRLQTTYHLNAKSLAEGVIEGIQHRPHALRIHEILDFALHAFDTKQWPLAQQWYETALLHFQQHDYSSITTIINVTDVMEDLAIAHYQTSNLKRAHRITQDLVNMQPDNKRLRRNIEILEHELIKVNQSKDSENKTHNGSDKPEANLAERDIMMSNYEKLCRGETRQLTKQEQSKLKCWYRYKNPLLRLKPQKVERLWVTPEIFLFHDILTEKEAKWVKDTAYPKLERATIFDPNTGEMIAADYRVSKSAWLEWTRYAEVKRLSARAQAVTSLNFNYAEALQIANYGMGGQYEPHLDFAREDEPAYKDLESGNRIATMLFYLTDVTAGGATVFTEAKAAVYPVKNAAVFWFNLKRNGKGNGMTKHAACPVLLGQKWVANWWIHEHGQELWRPCARKQNW